MNSEQIWKIEIGTMNVVDEIEKIYRLSSIRCQLSRLAQGNLSC